MRTGVSNAPAWFSAALVFCVGGATLVGQAAGLESLAAPARIGFLVWLVANLHRLRGVERGFLAASLAVTAMVLAFLPEPWPVLVEGLDRAAMFLTFVATLNLLRDAAQSSIAVRRAGHYLITQSPPRRYAAITLGGHIFTIALNMGALNLIGSMIHRSNTLAAAGGDPAILAIRERRMMSALMRGFGATLMWSPLGVSVAYTLSLIPSLTWFDVAPVGVAIAFAWLATGWLLDRLEWPPSARRAALPPPKPASPREALPMLGITTLLVIGVIVAKLVLGISLLYGVMTAVPLMALIWIAAQYARFGVRLAAAASVRRLRQHALVLLPQARPEAIVLSAAGYIGVALAALVDAGGLSSLLSTLTLPPALLAFGAFLLILLPAQIGVTPLVTATIVGSTIAQMNPVPLPPLALVLAMQAGWSLSSSTSPYTGGPLMLARLMGKKPAVIQQWNARYAVACALIIAITLGVWLG